MKKFFLLLTVLFFLIIGVASGYFWGYSASKAELDKKLGTIHPLRENNPEYKFINPLLAYLDLF